MRNTFLTLSTLLTTLHALTITSPAAGSSLDPSKPITITWARTPADPATFTLLLDNPTNTILSADPNSKTLGTDINTSAGTYTIPANKIATFGSGFTLLAVSAAGDNLATSGSFLLAYGSGQVVTGADSATSLTSISFDTSGLTGSVTASYLPSTDISTTVTGSALSSLVLTTGTVTGSMTVLLTGSLTTRTGTSAATTINAQGRVAVKKEVVGVAGVLAGMVAMAI